jgi:hypothetical protein
MISAIGDWRSLRPSIGARLDDLLAARVLPCSWPARDWAVCKLPSRLERCGRDLAPDLAWRPYGNADRPLFVIARAHRPKAGNWRDRALDVYFLDGHAVVHCAGVWMFDASRGWRNLEQDND